MREAGRLWPLAALHSSHQTGGALAWLACPARSLDEERHDPMSDRLPPLEDIPGELPADRQAREARRRRSVTYVGRGHARRRQIQKAYPRSRHTQTTPLAEQHEGRVVSVTLVRRAGTED